MHARLALSLAVAGLMALGMAGTAQASITVANQNDSGGGSLRQAIAEAPSGETIVLPAGTYTLTSGALSIVKAVTISGHSAADTTVRAGGAFSVFNVSGSFAATISGVTIRDGNPPPGPVVLGGGVKSTGANLTLRSVVLTHNTANANGAPGSSGGVALGGAVFAEGGTLSLLESNVTGNLATANGGSEKAGGVPLGGGVYANGALTVLNSSFSGNTAIALGGGGPSNAGQDGGVALGGGLYAVPEGQSSNLAGLTVTGNVADASGGAGGSGGVGLGGGVYVGATMPALAFANSTIAANLTRVQGAAGVALGGGVYASGSPPGSVSLLSITVSGNRLEAPPGPSVGGNLFSQQNVSIGNSIVSGGIGPAGSENCAGELTSRGFNLDSLDQCGFHYIGDLVKRDPLLGPLQDNGGPTQTMAPAANSPAIDQGSALGLSADQRGVLRPIDLPTIPNSAALGADGSDIGAFELQPSNALQLGKLKKDKKKGTAKLTVTLPQPSAGTLVLSGKGLKKQTKSISGQSSVKLAVATKGKAAKSLRKSGKAKVKIEVVYTPIGNTAGKKTRSTKLVRKSKK